jgi:RNA polymerase sigma-70 factor, ECF subfamily
MRSCFAIFHLLMFAMQSSDGGNGFPTNSQGDMGQSSPDGNQEDSSPDSGTPPLDHQLFEQAYQDYREDLMLFCRKRGVAEDDAADIVQNAFIVFWNKLNRVQQGKEFSFLLGAANRLLKSHWRNESAQPSVSLDDEANQSLVNTLANPLPVSSESETDTDGRVQHLRIAIAALPARQRQVMELLHSQSLSAKEIADALGIAESTVRVHQKKACDAISEALNQSNGCEL